MIIIWKEIVIEVAFCLRTKAVLGPNVNGDIFHNTTTEILLGSR